MIETCVVEELPPRMRSGPGGAERSYLLTGGLARCGICAGPLEAKPAAAPHECATCGWPIRGIRLVDLAGGVKCPNGDHLVEPKKSRPGNRGYACTKTPPNSGCGRIRIVAESLEAFVAKKVLARYAHPESVRLLSAQVTASAQTGRALAVEIGATEDKIKSIAIAHARGTLGETAFCQLEAEYESQLRAMRHQAATTTVIESFPVTDDVDALQAWWEEGSTVQERHDLVQVLLDEVRILPAQRRGYHGFDERRVEIVWTAG